MKVTHRKAVAPRIRASIVLLLPAVIVGSLWVRASQTSTETANLPADPNYLKMALAATAERDRVVPAAKSPFDTALSLAAPLPVVDCKVVEPAGQSGLFSLAERPFSAILSSAGKLVDTPTFSSPVANCNLSGRVD